MKTLLQTGTLTADTQSVSRLVSALPCQGDSVNVTEAFQKFQLAGCSELVHLDPTESVPTSSSASHVVGDPLEIATLEYSGWHYNGTDGSYVSPVANSTDLSDDDPVRLWKIKSFSFDPNRRLSTTLVLMQTFGGNFHLVSLTKGSPETVKALYSPHDESDFDTAFETQRNELESSGYRSIAFGTKDLSRSSISNELFPNGLHKDTIDEARQKGSSLHRSDFENGYLTFGGFACFDATIRPSSTRVVSELLSAGIKCTMLTGDSIDAAIAVASKVGLFQCDKVAILETTVQERDGSPLLRFRHVQPKHNSQSEESIDVEEFSMDSLARVLKRQSKGKLAIAASGAALELVFRAGSNEERKFVNNLSRVSVIARATPKLKELVVTNLQSQCGEKVMMCGRLARGVVGVLLSFVYSRHALTQCCRR